MDLMRRIAFFLLIAIFGWLPFSQLNQPTPVAAQSSGNDLIVEVIGANPVKLYNNPALNAQVLQTIPKGRRVVWNGASRNADKRNWLNVSSDGVAGWVSPDNETMLVIDSTWISPYMERSVVFQSEKPLALRAQPNMPSSVTLQVPAKTQLRVIDGPFLDGVYTWWQAQTLTGTPQQGWFAETLDVMQVAKPLTVYNYRVCEGFNLKQYGVAGWDSIVQSLPTLVPTKEPIVCLASTNLKGDKTPIVVILSTTNLQSPMEAQETLRIFEQRNGIWTTIYQQTTELGSTTGRLQLIDATNEGKPSLFWASVTAGTGGFVDIKVLRYDATAGIQPILSAESLYKGGWATASGRITLTQSVYTDTEPNCCHEKRTRFSYRWENNRFVKIGEDTILEPYWLQGLPPELKLKQ